MRALTQIINQSTTYVRGDLFLFYKSEQSNAKDDENTRPVSWADIYLANSPSAGASDLHLLQKRAI